MSVSLCDTYVYVCVTGVTGAVRYDSYGNKSILNLMLPKFTADHSQWRNSNSMHLYTNMYSVNDGHEKSVGTKIVLDRSSNISKRLCVWLSRRRECLQMTTESRWRCDGCFSSSLWRCVHPCVCGAVPDAPEHGAVASGHDCEDLRVCQVGIVASSTLR